MGLKWRPEIRVHDIVDKTVKKLKKKIAYVASVSSRVIARKLERKQKSGWRGRERGEEETLARKPHDSGKRPLIFHGSVDF